MTDTATASSPASSLAALYIGIDVALDHLDLARSDSDKLLTVANDDAGIKRLVELLRSAKPTLIVVEATGGIERALADALLEANLPVALVNPAHVRHFAKALGILAKTDKIDKIDAHVLAHFARVTSPRLLQKRSQSHVELEALVTCRRQLLLVRTEQGNRRRTTASKAALKSVDAVLKTIDRQIDSLDQQIRKLIESDDDFNTLDKLLQSAPGVGPVLSATLVAELGELGQTNRQEIGALVGVAPFNRDSGRCKGKRSIKGGRSSVRSVLYMATLSAIRFNPIIRVFAERLKKAGKLPMVTIVACMRKLITLLNAMVQNNLPWNQLNVVKNP